MCLTTEQAAARQAAQANGAATAAEQLARTVRALESLLDRNVIYDGSTVLLEFDSHGQAFAHINEARSAAKAAIDHLTGAQPC